MTKDADVLERLIKGTKSLDEELKDWAMDIDRRLDWIENLAENRSVETKLTPNQCNPKSRRFKSLSEKEPSQRRR